MDSNEANDEPTLHWWVVKAPTQDVEYFFFSTPPVITRGQYDASTFKFVSAFTLFAASGIDYYTQNLGVEYETVFGDLTGHEGQFIYSVIFQNVEGGLLYTGASVAVLP